MVLRNLLLFFYNLFNCFIVSLSFSLKAIIYFNYFLFIYLVIDGGDSVMKADSSVVVNAKNKSGQTPTITAVNSNNLKVLNKFNFAFITRGWKLFKFYRTVTIWMNSVIH